MKRKIVVLSGLAGAGKSTAARALEDLGFFVVDNLPPQLIETLLQLTERTGAERSKLAFVVDAREADFLLDFGATWERLRNSGHALTLLFFEANDDTLIRRFQETRRRHPLDISEGGARAGVLEALARERALLADLAMHADAIIDTRDLSVHDLKRLMVERFGQEGAAQRLLVTLESFGFKHGLPRELDMCLDVRFLPNPYFVPDLRPLNGTDAPVFDYVMGQPDAREFVDKLVALLRFTLPRFEVEGKSYVTIAIGCTGGQHRSVAVAIATAERLVGLGLNVRVVHRDAKHVTVREKPTG